MTMPLTEGPLPDPYMTGAYMSMTPGVEIAGDLLRDGLIVTDDRHPSTRHMSKHFAFGHLPPHLQDVSVHFAMVAQFMVDLMRDGPELAVALRSLWDSKNSAVLHAGFLGNLVEEESRGPGQQESLDRHYDTLPKDVNAGRRNLLDKVRGKNG